MKKEIIRITFTAFFFLFTGIVAASENAPDRADNTDRKQENTDGLKGHLQSAVDGIDVAGGISAGYFYASNPEEEASNDAFLLSNFLVEISSSDTDLPVEFVGAFGQTSTPSILFALEGHADFKIEYASLTLRPVTDLMLEIGLLQPNAGYENSYTYNNMNAILGAVASQQPYNAYGGRVAYDAGGLSLWGGYFKERLVEEEYYFPENAWEIGLNGSILDSTFSLFHYNIKDRRSLSGVAVERTVGHIDFALNIDYWRWNGAMKNLYGSSSSMGGAFYIRPNFGRFSIPLRLEYINQKNSQLYIESPDTKHIYTATVSPTWHYNENAYIRGDAVYVRAEEAFSDNDGRIKESRIYLALELVYLF